MNRSNEDHLLRELYILIILIFAIGFFAGFFTGIKIISWLFLLYTLLLFMITLCFWMVLLDFRPRLKGLIGELEVAMLLEHLWGKGVRSLHKLRLKKEKGDIDHVAISKSGVWVIENKNIGGKITYSNGILKRNDKSLGDKFLDQVWAEYYAVSECLKKHGITNVPIYPVLLFSDKFAKIRIKENKKKGVHVVRKEKLEKLLLDSEESSSLQPKNIEKIFEILKYSDLKSQVPDSLLLRWRRLFKAVVEGRWFI